MGWKAIWLVASLVLVGIIAPLSSGASKAKKITLDQERVLKGEWRGEAKCREGKNTGRTLNWHLVFGKGDLSEVSGTTINAVQKVEVKKFHLTRPFKMRIVYAIEGTHTFDIAMEVELDPTCTRMTGKFVNVMGTGTYELVKQNRSPGASQLKGNWTGTATGKKGSLARKDLAITLVPGKKGLDTADATFGDFPVSQVVASYWDPQTREAVFFFRCTKIKKKERWIQVNGTFDSEFNTFEGSFASKKIGSGTVVLHKAKTSQPASG